jgi:hypothetical protein
MEFTLRWDELEKHMNEYLSSNITIETITLSCGN